MPNPSPSAHDRAQSLYFFVGSEMCIRDRLSRVLMHMDMLVRVAVVDKSVELRSGLVSEASCSLTT